MIRAPLQIGSIIRCGTRAAETHLLLAELDILHRHDIDQKVERVGLADGDRRVTSLQRLAIVKVCLNP